MKQKILKLSTVILPIIIGIMLVSSGCQKDDDIFEIQIGDENAVIVKEVDGIEFKFCLLNEQGEPATVFNEGENFTFSFTVKNNLDKTIYFDTSVVDAEGFCEVKNRNTSFGIPYKKPTYVLLRISPGLKKGNISGVNIEWFPEDEEWNIGVIHFFREDTEILKKGVYYTGFTHAFDFELTETGKLTFKINFEIK